MAKTKLLSNIYNHPAVTGFELMSTSVMLIPLRALNQMSSTFPIGNKSRTVSCHVIFH